MIDGLGLYKRFVDFTCHHFFNSSCLTHRIGNLGNHVVIKFYETLSLTNLYNSYFTGLFLHAVNNTWLTPVTACGSQSTACGI